MRTIIWFGYFWGYMLLHLPALRRGMRALKAGNTAASDAIAQAHVPEWCGKLLDLAGTEITVIGRENLPQNRPCVFVANHRSAFDIPLMLTQLGKPVSLISKIEVRKIPLIRRWMELLHCLFLDRSNPRQGIQVISDAAQLVQQGYSVGIFPEGTRYKGSEGELGPFQSGAFRIAVKSSAPIVPVAIRNSRACLEGDGHLTIKPAKITIRILPPIETAGLSRLETKALPELTQQKIREALTEIA